MARANKDKVMENFSRLEEWQKENLADNCDKLIAKNPKRTTAEVISYMDCHIETMLKGNHSEPK